MTPPPRPSKSRLNHAGDVLREVGHAVIDGDARRLTALLDESGVNDALALTDHWRSLHARPLGRVSAGLRYHIRRAGITEFQVTQRLKRLSTIVTKLGREPKMALARMEDIGGVRAVLPRQRDVGVVVDRLRQRWSVRRLREYIDGGHPGPKDDGYRAVHVIVEKDGYYVEVQLRTRWQDVWAQSVEQDTRALGVGLKFGEGPDDLREYYELVSELFAMREADIEPDEEFLEQLAKHYTAVRRHYPRGEGDGDG